MRFRQISAFGACAALAAPSVAQTVRLTHNEVTDSLTTTDFYVGCTLYLESTSDQSWWRAFNLADFGITGSLTVTSVEFAVRLAQAPHLGGSQPVRVDLFQAPAGSRPALGLELRGSGETMVLDHWYMESSPVYLPEAPVQGVIDAGASLVVSVTPPDHSSAFPYGGDYFYIGYNAFGETDPSYLMAPSCGIETPMTFAELGASPEQRSVVMIVHGVLGATGCYADCDESGALDFFDFLCFQNAFAAGEAYADCDESGSLDFFDFLCFQNEFAAGCP